MGNGESVSKLVSEVDDDKCIQKQTSVELTSQLGQVLINNSRTHGVGENISRKSFVEYFHSDKVPEAGALLYVRFIGSSCGAEPPPSITSDTFAKFCGEIRNLVIQSHLQKYYLLLFSKGKPTIERDAVEDFFRACFLFEAQMVGSKYHCDSRSSLLRLIPESLAQACVHSADSISVDSLQTWIAKNCPDIIHSSIHRWVVHCLHVIQPSFATATDSPSHNNWNGAKGHDVVHNYGWSKGGTKGQACIHSDNDDSLLHPMLEWLFDNTLPGFYTKPSQLKLPSPVRPTGQAFYDPHKVLNTLMRFNSGFHWHRLYSSLEHGRSMNRFQHHVFSYRGPTAMLVKADADVLLCICVDQEWRERYSRWGGEQCIAMQITPCFKVFEAGDNMMYFNLTTRGLPFGLHVGRSPKSPVLEIDRDLCLATVKKIPYKLECLEVWGCAGEEIKEAQKQQKKWETDQVEKQKKVNLNAVEWKENPDRYLLELAGRPSYSSTFKR